MWGESHWYWDTINTIFNEFHKELSLKKIYPFYHVQKPVSLIYKDKTETTLWSWSFLWVLTECMMYECIKISNMDKILVLFLLLIPTATLEDTISEVSLLSFLFFQYTI